MAIGRAGKRRLRRLGVIRAPLLGAVIGAAAAGLGGGSLSPPTPLDAARWQVLTPGLSDGLADPYPDRQIRVAEGALTLSHLAFGRVQRLTPRAAPALTRLEIELLSGEAELVWRAPDGGSVLFCLYPGAARPGGGGRVGF